MTLSDDEVQFKVQYSTVMPRKAQNNNNERLLCTRMTKSIFHVIHIRIHFLLRVGQRTVPQLNWANPESESPDSMTGSADPSDTIQEPNKMNGNSSLPNADYRHALSTPPSTNGTRVVDDEEEEDSSHSSSSSAATVSLDDSLGKNHGESTTKTIMKSNVSVKRNKRVSWDRIHTREFVLVVGDHPMCQDGLPVSLGWQYDDQSCSTKAMNPTPIENADSPRRVGTPLSSPVRQQQRKQRQQIQVSERRQSYVFPRRLSYEERRDRLVSVSNLTLDQIKNDEIDLVVRTLKESWDVEDMQCDQDVMMESADHCGANFHPIVDDTLMELDYMDAVPGIDIDFSDQDDHDLGDITNFQWR